MELTVIIVCSLSALLNMYTNLKYAGAVDMNHWYSNKLESKIIENERLKMDARILEVEINNLKQTNSKLANTLLFANRINTSNHRSNSDNDANNKTAHV